MKIKKIVALLLFFSILLTNCYYVNASGSAGLKLNKSSLMNAQPELRSQQIALDFAPMDSILNPSKPVIYFTDSPRKRLYTFNYETKESSYIQFDLTPEKMAIYNNQLYVTLLISGHDAYSTSPEQGAVSIINLDTFTEIQRLKMNFDPYDIAVDKNGYIYLAPGSNQHNYLKSYSRSAAGGSIMGYIKELSSSSMYMSSLILMHPTMNKVYSINTPLSPRDISVYNFDNNGVLGTSYNSPYHGDYPMSTVLKISPEGRYVFNGAGTVFSSSSNIASDMKYLMTLDDGFNDIAFDLETNLFFTASTGKANIDVYNYDTFEKKGSIATSAECKFLFYQNSNLIAITTTFNNYSLQVIPVSSIEPIIEDVGEGINMYGKIIDTIYDSKRNKAYAIDNGLNNLFILDLSNNVVEKIIKLNYRPSGLCLSEDSSKIYIANDDLNYLITEINLSSYATRTEAFNSEPNYNDYAHKKIYEKAGKLFVITGEWTPKLMVFDSSTLKRLTSYPILKEVGGLALSSDGEYMYTWRQYGWSTGDTYSHLSKYEISSGTFTQVSEGTNQYFERDPLNTPIFLLEEDGIIICKGCVFDIDDLSANAALFSDSIYAINSTNTIASSKKGIYNLNRDQYFEFIPQGEHDVKFFSNSGTLYIHENNSLYYLIPIPGDNNGDSFVDITDLAAAARSYNAKKGSSNFEVSKDLNYDNIIDIFDLVIVSRNLGY